MKRFLILIVLSVPALAAADQCYMDVRWQGTQEQCEQLIEEVFVVGQRPSWTDYEEIQRRNAINDFRRQMDEAATQVPPPRINEYGDTSRSKCNN